MMLFSERQGIKPVKSILQVDSMDEELRTGLWNALTIFYWDRLEPGIYGRGLLNHEVYTLCQWLWHCDSKWTKNVDLKLFRLVGFS
jgi:hypothetical protein